MGQLYLDEFLGSSGLVHDFFFFLMLLENHRIEIWGLGCNSWANCPYVIQIPPPDPGQDRRSIQGIGGASGAPVSITIPPAPETSYLGMEGTHAPSPGHSRLAWGLLKDSPGRTSGGSIQESVDMAPRTPRAAAPPKTPAGAAAGLVWTRAERCEGQTRRPRCAACGRCLPGACGGRV